MFISKIKILFVFSMLSVFTLLINGCGDPNKKTALESSSGILTVVSDAADGFLSSVTPSSTENKCTEVVDAYLSAILHRDFTKMEEIDKKGLLLKDASSREMNGPTTYINYRDMYKKSDMIRISGSQHIVDKLNEKKLEAQKKITWEISTESLGVIPDADGVKDGIEKFLVNVHWKTIDQKKMHELLSDIARLAKNAPNPSKMDSNQQTTSTRIFSEQLSKILDNPPMKEEDVYVVFYEESENIIHWTNVGKSPFFHIKELDGKKWLEPSLESVIWTDGNNRIYDPSYYGI